MDEVAAARYALIPDYVEMAMMLPRQAVYINVHENTFQLWQVIKAGSRRYVIDQALA